MIPVWAYEGQKVGILGLGRSGIATAKALRAGGAVPIGWDDSAEAREAAKDQIEIVDISRERESAELVALIVSPGIPHLYPSPHKAVQRAWENDIPVDNDVGLFFAAIQDLEPEDDDGPDPKIICITGSNGKSTTTALIHHILNASGRPTQMGGNIGRGVLDLDPPGAGEVIVLELSSYQIELARRLAPDIAVFLNLSPDHLDRHGGQGGYFAAKRRLFEAGAPEVAIIGVDEMEGRYLASISEAPTLISAQTRPRGDGRSVFMNRNHLTEWRGRQVMAIDLRAAEALKGAHNHQNAAAAYAVCRALGVTPRQIEPALMSFPGLAHRMEKIVDINGVAYVNDSKATNADAAEKALLSYDNIRWIAGGEPKEGGIASLAPLFGRVAKAYLIGEAADAFAETLGVTPHEVVGTLDAAIAAASREAKEGETILLSPACASFDQFPSFEARGDAFRHAVQALTKEQT